MILAKCVVAWAKRAKQQSKEEIQRRKVEEIRNKYLVQHFFRKWHTVRAVGEYKERQADAVVQVKLDFLLRRCFGAWIRYWHNKKVCINNNDIRDISNSFFFPLDQAIT